MRIDTVTTDVGRCGLKQIRAKLNTTNSAYLL